MPRKKAVPQRVTVEDHTVMVADDPNIEFTPAPPTPEELAAARAARVPMSPEAKIAHAKRLQEEAKREAHGTAPQSSRIPMGQYRAKLNAETRPGFRRYWFKDVDSRVEAALNAGYAHVIDTRTGKPRQHRKGANVDGSPTVLFLMEIPNEFYHEDKIAKQETLNETEKAIYTGRHNQEPGDNTYIPRSTPMNFPGAPGGFKG